jgi:hypothetical protein
MRTQTIPEPQKSPLTPSKSPAFLAAQAAMQSRAAAAESDSSKLKKGAPNNAGLRKFFGKKTTVNEIPPRQSSQNTTLAPPAENGVSRRFSQMRRTKPAPTSNPTSIPAQPKPANSAAIAAATAATREPVLDMSGGNNRPSTSVSRTSTREEADAVHEFSRFDQGPLMDAPSAAAVESEDERTSTPQKGNLQQPNTWRPASATPEPVAEHDHFLPPPEFAPPRLTATPEYEKRATDSYDPQVVQDRWATIRENAHRRAKRGSEDQSTRSHLEGSQRTDDGETSGEESKFLSTCQVLIRTMLM